MTVTTTIKSLTPAVIIINLLLFSFYFFGFWFLLISNNLSPLITTELNFKLSENILSSHIFLNSFLWSLRPQGKITTTTCRRKWRTPASRKSSWPTAKAETTASLTSLTTRWNNMTWPTHTPSWSASCSRDWTSGITSRYRCRTQPGKNSHGRDPKTGGSGDPGNRLLTKHVKYLDKCDPLRSW